MCYYVDANGCAAIPGAPEALTRREAIAAALRAACHPGDVAVIIRAESVEQRGPNVYWRGGRVLRAFRGESRLVRMLRPGAALSAAWTPERGWHDIPEVDRRRMQRATVARITGRTVPA